MGSGLGDLRGQSHHPWRARPPGGCSEVAASVGFLLLKETRTFFKSGGIAVIYIESSNQGRGGEPLRVMSECISLCGLSHPKGIEGKLWDGVMYGCESWTEKKAERQRIDAFELWCWRRLLRVPRTARRSNQSILKEISPECSLEGLMLKLKLQYFGHLM